MKNGAKYLPPLLYALLLACPVVNAQWVTNTTGNVLRSDSVSYAYSVGEITAFPLNIHCNFTPGVIQPAINYIEKPVVNAFGQYHEAILYPNPTQDIIVIETSYPDLTYYQIAGIDGKIIETARYLYAPIHIGRLQRGLYLLTIFSTNFKVKQTFKVYKQ